MITCIINVTITIISSSSSSTSASTSITSITSIVATIIKTTSHPPRRDACENEWKPETSKRAHMLREKWDHLNDDMVT